jgi:hypothetical protein
MSTADFPGVRWRGHWVAPDVPEFVIDPTSVGSDLPPAEFSRAQFRRVFDVEDVPPRVPLRLSADFAVRAVGHLDPAWTEWFAELAVTQKDDGTTELVGQFSDQSALYGLLARLRDLGATLLMVAQLPASGAEPVIPRCVVMDTCQRWRRRTSALT